MDSSRRRGWLSFPAREAFPVHRGLLAASLLAIAGLVIADPYTSPPYWGGGTGPAVHFAPVAWPSDGSWIPYTRLDSSINDQAVNDGTNGGTSPQGYVNVSSGCTDTTAPSIYYAFGDGVLFFRWRVQAAPNTYATGPSAGSVSSSSPWSSALWTVLIDTNGDGFRDFAVQLDGSSGSPSASVDRLTAVYSTSRSQSVDYIGDPSVHLLAHNPTAFVDQTTNRILNFLTGLTPSVNWPNGAAETVWNYGTTRTSRILGQSCAEYFIDYQIPLGMLDASGVLDANGAPGPVVTANTPLALFFATSNSLTNPMQKDVVLSGDPFVADVASTVPFGDTVVPGAGAVVRQPVVQSVSGMDCGPAQLVARVVDALKPVGGSLVTSVASVEFFYWFDADGDGHAGDGDAGSSWVSIGAGTTSNAPVGQWTAAWANSTLPRGQYLLGVKATDDEGHTTYGYLTQAQVNGLPGATADDFANPAGVGVVTGTASVAPPPGGFGGSCGVAPTAIELAADAHSMGLLEIVQLTATVSNTGASPITVSSVTATLPDGFEYVSTDGGTLGAASGSISGTGTRTWTLSPATVAAGGSGTLLFTARATSVASASATASAATSTGTLESNGVLLEVVVPPLTLGLAASPDTVSAGGTANLVITLGNASTVSATSIQVVATLPAGLSCPAGALSPLYGTATCSSGTVTWNVAALNDILTSIDLTVPAPVDAGASGVLAVTATVTSDQTASTEARTVVFVDGQSPAFALKLGSSASTVSPGGSVTVSIAYTNVGTGSASGTQLTFAVPSGFTASNIGNGGNLAGSTVTWSPGVTTAGTVLQGESGTVTLDLTAGATYTGSNPATLTASIDATETTPVSDTFSLGVTLPGDLCQDYYFRNTTTSVGADGSKKVANTTSTSGEAGSSVTVTTAGNISTLIPVVAFYQDPANGNDVNFSGDLTTSIWVDKNNGQGVTVHGTVCDYDPAGAADNCTIIGTKSQAFANNDKGQFQFTIPVSGTLQSGHRLKWDFKVSSSASIPVQVQWGGNVANTYSGGTNAAVAMASFCTARPAFPTLETDANPQVVGPGASLVYTITFGNAGQTHMEGSSIVHELPAGVTYQSATLNGSPISPSGNVGQAYTFPVKSSDSLTAGRITAGLTGTLVVSATVDNPFSGSTPLTSTTTLGSEQTSSITDTRSVALLAPAITVFKVAGYASSPELPVVGVSTLEPGDTLTYEIRVMNNGSGPATSVVVTDVVPATDEFTYVAGSTTLQSLTVSPDPYNSTTETVTVNVGTLAAGASARVTFQMRLGAGGAAAGVTSFSNSASVGYTEAAAPATSNAAAVSVRSTPALGLTYSATPSPTVAAGDEVTFTAVATSVGTGAVTGARLVAALPGYATYVPGSLRLDGSAVTEAADGDAARVDLAGGEVVAAFSSMAAGSSHTLSFRVVVDDILPSGDQSISSTASASASDADTQSQTAGVTAEASPNLSVVVTAPAAVAFPLATLADPASSTTLRVVSAGNLAAGQVIGVQGLAGTFVDVTGVSGQDVTVSDPVTAAAGTQLLPTLEYVVTYQNSGKANATDVVISVPLPAGVTFVSATGGGTATAGTVTWPAISVVPPGGGGTFRLRVAPSAPGTFTATPTYTSNESVDPVQGTPASSSAGAVALTKRVLTPSGTSSGGVVTVTYEITAVNQHPSQSAANVNVRDVLPTGFTYLATSDIVLSGGATGPASSPTPGDEQPQWGGFTLPGNAQVTIEFTANVANVAAGTFNNDVQGSRPGNEPLIVFDGQSTTAEDVTFAAPVGTTATLTSTASVTAGTSATITLGDIDLDTNPSLAQTVVVTVENQSSHETENVTLTETGVATGVFTGTLATQAGAGAGTNGDGTMRVAVGATLRASHVDTLTSAGGDVTVTADTSITASGSNTAPVATAQDVTTAEDTAVGITLAGTDADGNPLTYTVATGPSHGSLSGTAPSLTYTPTGNYHGPDSFTFTVNDGTVSSSAATVSITVSSANDAPSASADSYSTPANTALTVDAPGVLDNDSDADGQTLTAAVATQPSHGTLTLYADGSFTYTPSTGYSGADAFTYTASDGTASSSAATVSITVNAGGTAPYVTSVGVPANGTYRAGQSLDFTVNWSEAVIVDATGGTPRIAITLNTGGVVYATYVSGSGTSALLFRLVVSEGQEDLDGITVGTAVALNGGTIRDAVLTDALTTLNNVASTALVFVDTTPPTVTIGAPSVTTTQHGPVTFTVTYSGADAVTLANANVTLNTTGTATGTAAVSGAGTATRTVTVTGITGQGTIGISVASGTAADTAGNQAAAAGPSATFSVVVPSATRLTPTSGVASGGVRVTITGSGFSTLVDPRVTFGGVPVLAVDVVSDTELRVVTPPLPAGTAVDVVILDGTDAVETLDDAYTPLSPPPADTTDDDEDGLPDDWELTHGLDPQDPGDADDDPDDDGLTNAQEFQRESHPQGTWIRYFAEGVTQQPMRTFLTLFNPDVARTSVVLRFLRDDSVTITHTLDLAAGERTQLAVASVPGMDNAAFGVEIEASATVAVESTVAWDATGYGAHAERALEASTSWYFGEGATHDPFDLFFLLLNPSEQPAEVTVRFLQLAPLAPVERHYTIAPRSRANVWADLVPGLESAELSTVVTSTNGVPIVVERAMYASGDRWWAAGHRAGGAPAAGQQWYIAEGFTGPGFDTFLLLGNPGDAQAAVEIEYLGESGPLFSKTYTVDPLSRVTIPVKFEDASVESAPFSCRLRSTNGVAFIAERAMWWSSVPGEPWVEAHTSGDTVAGALSWAIADGAAGGTEQAATYVLVANLGTSPGSVDVTLQFDDGTTVTKSFPMAAQGRVTLDVGFHFDEARGRSFSATITSGGATPSPIVVERSMYWDVDGVHWAAGVSSPATPIR